MRQVLTVTIGNSTTTYAMDFFYDASGMPFAVKYNGDLCYYITNLQGDVMSIVDAQGEVVAEYEYDPEMGRFINVDALVSIGQGVLGNNIFVLYAALLWDGKMGKNLRLAFIVIIACMLCGCYGLNNSGKQYPWTRAECWYCKEIVMTIRFSVDESGDITEAPYSQLAIGGMICEVGIGFQGNGIGFLLDLDGDGIAERILDGTWSYRGENMVIQVNEESIFSEQYKELIFMPYAH